MSQDELYQEFTENYFETGKTDIAEDWPPELKKRCLFFLKLLQVEPSRPAPSLLAALEEAGDTKAPGLPEGAAPAPGMPADPAERYAIERELAHGGMGRVLLAYDRDLRRRIAIKVLRGALQGGSRLSRFREEAQATSQLEHPNIAPVYDLGFDASGCPFFTMKWIRGRDLEAILRSSRGEFSLIRLIQMLQQAAMGIDFAHSRGVIHRDLKPQNIMVGDFGEVLVVDWGLAKVLGSEERGERGPIPSGPVSTDRRESGAFTLDGSLQGSVPYMAPEQARGEASAVDARTDVFGLGAILYQILTGEAPWQGGSLDEALARARRGEVAPPSRRAPRSDIPPELETICMKALAARPEDRFPSARALHDDLQRYVEGLHDAERRAAEASRLLEEARRREAELRAAESREADLLDREAELRREVKDHDPEERKKPLWSAAEALQAAQEKAVQVFSQATSAYGAVLSIDPMNRLARGALADLFHRRLLAAEERKDREARQLYESLLAQYQDGQYGDFLKGETRVRIKTDPPGAMAFLSRYEERGLALAESPEENLGATPLEIRLPRGSYLLRFKSPAHHEVRFPLSLDRRPRLEAAVKLHPLGSIPPGFIQIPAGEAILGGAPQMLSTLPPSRQIVAEFFVARFPVTFAEYCAFLDDRGGGRGEELPGDLIPAFGREVYIRKGPDGRHAPIAQLHPQVPVFAIPHAAMAEYCVWLGRRISRPVRLPAEIEWERCARGADGRIYPWGNRFDWAFCKGARSRPGEPFPEAVGTFPRDRSPFGVQDLAGTIRELCDGWYEEGYRPCRGGAWWNPHAPVFRADVRTFIRDHSKGTDIGFRACYS